MQSSADGEERAISLYNTITNDILDLLFNLLFHDARTRGSVYLAFR